MYLWHSSTGWHLRVNEPGAVAFCFVNHGGMDGLDFVTRCSNTITVNVKMNGATVRAEDVFIGHDGYHPASVPFTISRGS